MTNDNNLEIVPVTFAAGESRIWAMSGQYFELIDCPSPVDVILADVNGAQRTRLKSAEASFYSKSVDFATITITSAAAQTIRFAYGSGEAGTRRSTGSVTIASPVDLTAATIIQLNRPKAPSASFSDMTALTANTPITVFTPAANVNGAILLSAHSNSRSAADAMQTFIAKNAAPVNIFDGQVLCMSISTVNTGTVFFTGGKLEVEQYIPAGLGLYFISNVATAVDGSDGRACRYKLL